MMPMTTARRASGNLFFIFHLSNVRFYHNMPTGGRVKLIVRVRSPRLACAAGNSNGLQPAWKHATNKNRLTSNPHELRFEYLKSSSSKRTPFSDTRDTQDRRKWIPAATIGNSKSTRLHVNTIGQCRFLSSLLRVAVHSHAGEANCSGHSKSLEHLRACQLIVRTPTYRMLPSAH